MKVLLGHGVFARRNETRCASAVRARACVCNVFGEKNRSITRFDCLIDVFSSQNTSVSKNRREKKKNDDYPQASPRVFDRNDRDRGCFTVRKTVYVSLRFIRAFFFFFCSSAPGRNKFYVMLRPQPYNNAKINRADQEEIENLI